jgi:LAO/AO transport system kinase
MSLGEEILDGDRRALARGLSTVERGGPEAAELLDEVWSQTGRARRIGVTGPPGAGKSTLVAGLVALLREADQRVAVVAVDPTSPFSGGALLGDRHRMTGAARNDEKVFVRSLASRGSLGGLSRAAPAALDLLDAAGFDTLIVETVGVGQSEIEVASTADSIAVVLSPESGDGVQAMKAGLIEIADVLCVNKADREGADELAGALDAMLDLKADAAWRPPVVQTVGLNDAAPLLEALARHEAWLADEERLEARRRQGLRRRLRALVADLLAERMLEGQDALLDERADDAGAGRCSVQAAAARAVEEILS